MLRRSNSWREGTESPGAGFSTFGVSPVQYFSYGYAQASPEQPIFTTKAHVFEIDPETKKNWVPSSKQAVAVSFYYDGTRNSYRIISVEGSKAIVNSTVTPSMTFTKTSQKFGQWSDARANTVYGLGFLSEGELSKFIEKFKEVKELTRAALQQKALEVNGSAEDQAINPPHPKALHQRTNSLSSIQVENSNSRGERRNSFTQGQGGQQANSAEAQLKYENDRLKLALAQSSTNAKKWEVELQTLKNNNARLTEALQESTANVEEWQKQLANYRQETARLKARLQSMELEQHTGRGGGDEAQLKSEINALTDQVETLRLTNSQKEEELESLRKQMAEVPGRSNQVTALQGRIQSLEEENHGLNKRLQELQGLVANLRAGRQDDHSDLLRLQDQLGSKITELYDIHEQLVATIKKESTS